MRFIAVDAGDEFVCGITADGPHPTHACALDADGAAFCWGDGVYGRLGRADQAMEPAPVAVETGLAFRSISAGGFHTCGIGTDGYTYCWGFNAYGQLGDGGDPTPGAVLRVSLP